MQILNPDGGEAEFSGNGSRIAAGYVAGRDGTAEVVLETLKGTVAGTVDGGSVTIDAGAAALDGTRPRPERRRRRRRRSTRSSRSETRTA